MSILPGSWACPEASCIARLAIVSDDFGGLSGSKQAPSGFLRECWQELVHWGQVQLPMTKHLKIGDHVRWNSEAGIVSGRIIKVHTRDTEYKGHPRHASAAEPQYEIKSDKTEHIAMHKGSALHKIT